ncbi:MAG: DUF3857 and transglutaminase domain-containing protein [Bacteroidetes bacterium]|nr:DUF3857 and transglutaminase domain-containing protein [Bacteroidota bacterium]
MILKQLAVFVCGMFISVFTFSQKKDPLMKFGNVTPDDFKQDVYSIDSSADAVYLVSAGYSKYEGNTQGWFSVVYTVHEKIRLLHKKSFDDLSKVKIGLYVNGSDYEKLDNLDAATYNLENGNVVVTKVDKNSIFDDKEGDYKIKKFTFPNLKEGSIIEYTYTTISPFYRDLPTWYFQGNYPKLISEFTEESPEFFDLVMLRQGYLTPELDTVISTADNFSVIEQGGVSSNNTYNIRSRTMKHTWQYKDVPGIKEESFITTLSNYVQKIDFQFSAIRFPNTSPQTFLSTWGETVDQLMKNERFGVDLDLPNGWLKNDIETAEDNATDALTKAKNIYAYVRDNYSCTDHDTKYLSQPIKKTQQSKKGNVADINLLLVAMLKVAGFDTYPALLSTRDNGRAFEAYPIISKFNYVIAQTTIDGQQYLLDASQPSLGFNLLPAYCYNGSARLIAPTPVLINLSPDSLHEHEVTSLFLTNQENGEIKGSYNHMMNTLQSIDMRDKMKKTNAQEYFNEVKKGFGYEVKMTNTAIDSLNKKEMPVSVRFDLSFKPEEDIIYFNPMIADAVYTKNPFQAATRSYPVEMPYCIDETYILNMQVPTGYVVDELPKSTRVFLNGSDGMFEYLIQQSGQAIQMRCITKINRATFESVDYETLRNFFAYVVQKENEQIVFKKQ